MFNPCIPEDIGRVAEPFAVLCRAVALLCPDVSLFDEPDETRATSDYLFGVTQPEGHAVHHAHDRVVAFRIPYVTALRHTVLHLLLLIS